MYSIMILMHTCTLVLVTVQATCTLPLYSLVVQVTCSIAIYHHMYVATDNTCTAVASITIYFALS